MHHVDFSHALLTSKLMHFVLDRLEKKCRLTFAKVVKETDLSNVLSVFSFFPPHVIPSAGTFQNFLHQNDANLTKQTCLRVNEEDKCRLRLIKNSSQSRLQNCARI